jgi:hypothetical protein
MKNKIQTDKRESLNITYNDLISPPDKHDFVEVTEWTNGDGYDFTFDDHKHISLTRYQFHAMVAAANLLDIGFKEKE